MQRLSEQLEFDPASGEIRGPDAVCTLEPQAMAVLVLLAGSPGEIWSRDRLLEEAWSGRVVADSTISAVISQLRGTLRSAGIIDIEIETLSKRGYRLKPIPPEGWLSQQRKRPGVGKYLVAGTVASVIAAALLILLLPSRVESLDDIYLEFSITLPDGQVVEPRIWLRDKTMGEIIHEGDNPLHLRVFPAVTEEGLLDLTFEASSLSHWMTMEQVIALGSESQLQLRADDGHGLYDIRFTSARGKPPIPQQFP
jgi:hypothetical protein